MKTLFSCLYGSRLYGTNLPESDYDRKNVVLPNLEDLLLGKTPKNIVQKFEGIDTEYVPIQVFAKDFLEGQTYALELAYAVKYDQAEQVVYDSRFYGFCEELRDKFLTSTMHSMVRYAVNQANLYSGKGERLNAAKDLSSFFSRCEQDTNVASCNMNALQALASTYPDQIQITTYDADGKGNIKPCIKVLTRVVPFASSVFTAKNTVDSIISKYGKRSEEASGQNWDTKATAHALRIICEGIQLLEEKNLTYPYREIDCGFYKSVRQGKESFDFVKSLIDTNMDYLVKLEKESTLPKLTPELRNELEIWLLGWLRKFYGLES